MCVSACMCMWEFTGTPTRNEWCSAFLFLLLDILLWRSGGKGFHLAFCTSLCAFLKVVYFPSVTDMLKFLWSAAWVVFFPPHSLLPHNYLYLLRTGCHREINASKNEKFLYAETLLCMPVLPQTREVTVVWRPYIPVQEAVFTMWLQGILARSRALSVQWWQYWKIKKICNCTNT